MSARINLIYKATPGRITGLERDALIIQKALKPHGFVFNHYKITERRLFKKYKIPQSLYSKVNAYCKTRFNKFDINIFLEKIYPDLLDLATVNILIPNQERFHLDWLPLLRPIDAVLCKTRYAEEIFRQYAKQVDYVGFTSFDRRLKKNTINSTQFLHVAGKSGYRRGTDKILELWKRYPDFPRLIVIAHGIDTRKYFNSSNLQIFNNYISDELVQQLQNQSDIHLCLSEAEGFGHFIMEGLSCGARAITTNGRPMDELVQSDRGYLVDCASIEREEKQLAQKFYFDPVDLEKTVLRAIEEPESGKIDKSVKARQHFEESERFFLENLPRAIQNLL